MKPILAIAIFIIGFMVGVLLVCWTSDFATVNENDGRLTASYKDKTYFMEQIK